MLTIKPYLDKINTPEHKERLVDLLKWILGEFPQLELVQKWNQPMLLDHGVFIMGFSISKKHIALAPEYYAMVKFADMLDEAGYERSTMLFRIRWDQSIDYDLIKTIIQFKINDRLSETSFWK